MTAEETKGRNERRVVVGQVASDKGDKTIVVRVTRQSRHPKYGKYVRNTSRYSVHDEENSARVGDTVQIAETRRLSKTKTWRLVNILQRAELVE